MEKPMVFCFGNIIENPADFEWHFVELIQSLIESIHRLRMGDGSPP
jgi:hypothetical protein